jgi:hypothetical protein
MIYIALIVLLVGIELFYFKIADRYNIIETPIEILTYSITLRGGGYFPIALSIGFFGICFLGNNMAVILVATVSFVDDISLCLNCHGLHHAIAVGLVL